MTKTLLKITLLLMAIATVCLPGRSQTEAVASADGLTADSAAVSPDSLLAQALENYKVLKFRKFDGAPLDSVSPLAYECFKVGQPALEAQVPDSKEWLQAKEMLRDVQRDLLAGAFFYSKAGNSAEMTRYAQAFLDVSLLEAFRNDEIELDSSTLSMLAYISASGAYNNKDYNRAIDYFKVYLSTGDVKQREQVYIFMTQSCLQAGQWDLGIATATEALKVFPGQKHILLVAMQTCIDGGRGEHLQTFLTQALEASPTDERLLDIQGKLHEDAGDYEKALNVYNTLDQIRPNSLATAKHIGLCYYNMAVGYFNEAITQNDEKSAGRLRRRAKNYFASAADKFREVLESAPTSVPYLRSLGVCYLCLEDKYNFEKINERLMLLKEDPLADVFMPPPMTYSGNGELNYAQSQGSALKDAPSYSAFGRDYITERLDKWAKKGEFEPLDAYTARVNDKTIRAEYDRLNKEAADKYLAEYSSRLRINDLQLEPYDATNEVFRINSSFGPILLHVPLKNGEAEAFKDNFKSIRFQNPKFFIDNDSVRIADITFMAANGKKYNFNNARSLSYSVPEINIDFASILGTSSSGSKSKSNSSGTIYIAGKSDIDGDFIPVTNKRSDKTIALVIANENYKNVAKVPFAFADGLTMSQYMGKTLGIPESNINFFKDASLAETYDAMTDLQRKVSLIGPEAEVIVYYAGHGLPDENTSEAYLLASDASPTNSRTWFKLSDFYDTLSGLNAKSVTVFLDACFSGAERTSGDETIMSKKGARGVVIKAKQAEAKGNMFVLSAASGNETALPYAEKNHGLFTYFLLKKIQDSKGNVNLKDLSDYVINEVKRHSNFEIKKPQTPTVVTSGAMSEQWKNKKLVK